MHVAGYVRDISTGMHVTGIKGFRAGLSGEDWDYIYDQNIK